MENIRVDLIGQEKESMKKAGTLKLFNQRRMKKKELKRGKKTYVNYEMPPRKAICKLLESQERHGETDRS